MLNFFVLVGVFVIWFVGFCFAAALEKSTGEAFVFGQRDGF